MGCMALRVFVALAILSAVLVAVGIGIAVKVGGGLATSQATYRTVNILINGGGTFLILNVLWFLQERKSHGCSL